MKIEEALKQKKFETPQDKAWVNIIYTYNFLMDHITEVFKRYDITHQQYNVLRILRGKHPETACCSSVKEVMMDKNPDLTRLCDRLISKGFIERELNEENRRQVVLKITGEGLSLLNRVDPELKSQSEILNNLSNEESEHLSALLDKLRG